MHCPVTSSQRRVPQSQARRGGNGLCLGEPDPGSPRRAQSIGCRTQLRTGAGLFHVSGAQISLSPLRGKPASAGKAAQEMGQLTPAVGEAPVAGGTAGALSPDDIGLAGTLPTEGLALAAPCPCLVAPAGLGPVVVEEGERDGRVTAEPR